MLENEKAKLEGRFEAGLVQHERWEAPSRQSAAAGSDIGGEGKLSSG